MNNKKIPEVLSVNDLANVIFSYVNVAEKNQTIVIPEGVKKIGNKCFSHNKNIVEVYLPNSLIGIGNDAFNGCTKLKKVVCNAPIVNVKESAFSDCEELQVLNINMQIQDDDIKNILKNHNGHLCQSHLRFYKLARVKNDLVASATYEIARPSQPILPNITTINDKQFLSKDQSQCLNKNQYMNIFEIKKED